MFFFPNMFILINIYLIFMFTNQISGVAVHWFRKGLRLHDNAGLIAACESSSKVYPVFILDPHFVNEDLVGVNRFLARG